jgi:hypothetical protein
VEPISHTGHRFSTDVIRQGVWLYFRFTLNLREVEELMAIDHSAMFKPMVSAVEGEVELIAGDTIFRVLGRINRLISQIAGVKKYGRRNLSYANYAGAEASAREPFHGYCSLGAQSAA